MLLFGVYGVYSGDPGMGLAGLDFSWCQAPDRGLPCPDGIFFLHIDEKAKVVVIYNNLYIYDNRYSDKCINTDNYSYYNYKNTGSYSYQCTS